MTRKVLVMGVIAICVTACCILVTSKSSAQETSLRARATKILFHHSGLSKETVDKIRQRVDKKGWSIDDGEEIKPWTEKYKYNNNTVRYKPESKEMGELLKRDLNDILKELNLDVVLTSQPDDVIVSTNPEIWLKNK